MQETVQKIAEKTKNPKEAFQALLKKAELLKSETEHLVQEAKALSEAGLKEAEEIIEYAVTNWKKLVNVGRLFVQKKKTAKAKTKATKKAAAKTSSAKKATVKTKAKKKAKK